MLPTGMCDSEVTSYHHHIMSTIKSIFTKHTHTCFGHEGSLRMNSAGQGRDNLTHLSSLQRCCLILSAILLIPVSDLVSTEP